MNRYELLDELYKETQHNLYCYSVNSLMEQPKDGYEEQWHNEQEKLELINELIQEEKSQKFHLYTSMYNLINGREKRINHELAYLEDRTNGVSCYIALIERPYNEVPKYEMIFNLHKKDAFDSEYETIYSKGIEEDIFTNRENLKKAMADGLEDFKNFIELDKKTYKSYRQYYEEEEIQELE